MRDKLPPRLETSANAPGTTARAPTTTERRSLDALAAQRRQRVGPVV